MLSHKLRRYRAAAAQATDANFKQTTLLLHGDGTNGGQNNTFIDGSTNNFTITRNGNTTQGTFSPFSVADGEWSNYFDGSGDYLSTPNVAGLRLGAGDFTVEAWINPSRQTNTYDQPICGTYGYTGSDLGWFFGMRPTGELRLFMGGSSGAFFSLSSTDLVPINVWSHVVAVRSGTTVTLYLNGVSVATGTSSKDEDYTGIPFNIGTSYAFQLSPQTGNAGLSLQGYISNLRLVKGTAVYTSNFTPPTTPLTAITNTSLLTCQSNRFVDNSANNFTITRNGDVTVRPFSPFSPTAAYSASTNGGSGYFDGTGDFLALPSNAAFGFGSGDFTMECWFYKTTSNLDVLIDTRIGAGGNVNGMALYVQSNTLKAGNDAERLAGGTVVSNSWNHCAVVRSGNNLNLYLNGTRTATAAFSTTLSSASSPYIGNSAINEYTGGYISNARILKGTAQYTGTTYTIPTEPLTAITNTSLLCNFTNAAIIDNTGKNVLETVGNAQIDTGTKKFGTGSLKFDGTGDWLTVADNVDLQFGSGPFTIEAWIYIAASTGNDQNIIVKGSSSGTTGWQFVRFAAGTLVFRDTSSIAAQTVTTISTGTWTHVAAVREGTGSNQFKLYINGVSSATGTSATSFTNTEPMYIGQGRNAANFLNGYIDDLRITKGIARYTANFTAPTAPFEDR